MQVSTTSWLWIRVQHVKVQKKIHDVDLSDSDYRCCIWLEETRIKLYYATSGS
jgi:hypothetical protein